MAYQELSKLQERIRTLEGELAELRPPSTDRRIALAMIRREAIDSDVFDQWQEILWRRRWPGPRFVQRAIYPVWGRNDVTSHALGRDDWTDIYWTDDDMMPDLGVIARLLELVELPEYRADNGGIICGSYYGGSFPFEVQLYERHPDYDDILRGGTRPIQPATWIPAIEVARRCGIEEKPAPLLPVAGGGTGSMLIRRDLLERMEARKGRGKIWESPLIDPGVLQRMKSEGTDHPGGIWTEDIWLCVEASELYGVQVYADTDFRLSSAHVKKERVGVNHYVAAHQLPEGFHLEKQRAVELPSGYEIQSQPMNRQQRRAAARR